VVYVPARGWSRQGAAITPGRSARSGPAQRRRLSHGRADPPRATA